MPVPVSEVSSRFIRLPSREFFLLSERTGTEFRHFFRQWKCFDKHKVLKPLFFIFHIDHVPTKYITTRKTKFYYSWTPLWGIVKHEFRTLLSRTTKSWFPDFFCFRFICIYMQFCKYLGIYFLHMLKITSFTRYTPLPLDYFLNVRVDLSVGRFTKCRGRLVTTPASY
jgi:hypothetical protein